MIESPPAATRTESAPLAPVAAVPAPRLPGHAWTGLADNQGNTDALPERYVPPTGCPECGSVWTHVEQVAFPTKCYLGTFLPERWAVQQVGTVVRIGGVRLRCYSGHLVEFDGVTLTVIPPLPMSTMLMVGIAGLGMLAMFGYGRKAQ